MPPVPVNAWSQAISSLALNRYVAGLACVLALVATLCCGRPASGQTVGGVSIDAAGALRQSGEIAPADLDRLRRHSERTTGELNRPSSRRQISLRLLEEAAAQSAGEGGWPAEIRYLAGLVRLDGLVLDRERNDVVLVGVAEPWEVTPRGEIVGVTSGRPVLELDDLIVALRYAFPRGTTDDFIGCSIDPSPEGLAAFDRLMRTTKTTDATRAEPLAQAMEQALGPQQISIFGVPAESRFALKLVAADYRLKRLALGHDPAPVRGVTSYLDLLTRHPATGRVPQQRWWFALRSDAVQANADRTVWHFEPDAVAVQTARAAKSGSGRKEPAVSREAEAFADQATRAFPELARKISVFAGLSNLMQLGLAAEIVHQAAADPRTAETTWRPEWFLDEAACRVSSGTVPRQTPALVSVRRTRGGAWAFAVSGGVEFRPEALLADPGPLTGEEPPPVSRPPEEFRPGRWWWDAE